MKKLMIGAAAAVVAAGAYAEVLNWTFNGKAVVTSQKAGADWRKQGTVKTYALSVDGEMISWTGTGKNATVGTWGYQDVTFAALNNGDLNAWVKLPGGTAQGFGKLDKDGALKSASGSYVVPTAPFVEYGTWSVKKNATVEKKLADGVALDKAYKFPAGIADDIAKWQDSWKGDYEKRVEDAATLDDLLFLANDVLAEAVAKTNDAQLAYNDALAVKAAYYTDMTNFQSQAAADQAALTKLADKFAYYTTNIVVKAVAWTNEMNTAYTNAVATQKDWVDNYETHLSDLGGIKALWEATNETYLAAINTAKDEVGKSLDNLKTVLDEEKTAKDAFYAQVNLSAKLATSDKEGEWKAVEDKNGNVTNFCNETTGAIDGTASTQLAAYYAAQAKDAAIKAYNCEVAFDYGIADNETNEINKISLEMFVYANTLDKRNTFLAAITNGVTVTDDFQLEFVTATNGTHGTFSPATYIPIDKLYHANPAYLVGFKGELTIKDEELTKAKGNVTTAEGIIDQIETYKKSLTDPVAIGKAIEALKGRIEGLVNSL